MKIIYIIITFLSFSCVAKQKQLSNICYGVFDLENMRCKPKKLNNDSTYYFRYELKNDTFFIESKYTPEFKLIKNKKNDYYFGQIIEKKDGIQVTNIYLFKDKIITESPAKRFNGNTAGFLLKSYTPKETLIIELGNIISTYELNKEILRKYRNLIDEYKQSFNPLVFDGYYTEKMIIRYIENKDGVFEEHTEITTKGKTRNISQIHRNIEVLFFDNFLFGINHAIR